MGKRRPGTLPATLVELLTQTHSATKNLENSTLAGPCFRVPKSAQNRLRAKVPPELKISGCVKDNCACPRTHFKESQRHPRAQPCSDLAKKTF